MCLWTEYRLEINLSKVGAKHKKRKKKTFEDNHWNSVCVCVHMGVPLWWKRHSQICIICYNKTNQENRWKLYRAIPLTKVQSAAKNFGPYDRKYVNVNKFGAPNHWWQYKNNLTKGHLSIAGPIVLTFPILVVALQKAIDHVSKFKYIESLKYTEPNLIPYYSDLML